MTIAVELNGQNTQVLTIISGAIRALGSLAPGEPLDPSEAQDAFEMLNDMLDQWSNEKLMVYYINEIIQTIAGQTAWTIGYGAQINVQRPLRINSAFVRVNTIDYPVGVINVEQYEMIGLKQLNGPWPRALYYQPTMPYGVVNFWPNPSSGEIHMFADTLFSRFLTVNDYVILPQGFNNAIKWNLAELLIPEYGTTNPTIIQLIQKNAMMGKALIKRVNMQPQQVAMYDDAIRKRNGADAGWILSGGFIT